MFSNIDSSLFTHWNCVCCSLLCRHFKMLSKCFEMLDTSYRVFRERKKKKKTPDTNGPGHNPKKLLVLIYRSFRSKTIKSASVYLQVLVSCLSCSLYIQGRTGNKPCAKVKEPKHSCTEREPQGVALGAPAWAPPQLPGPMGGAGGACAGWHAPHLPLRLPWCCTGLCCHAIVLQRARGASHSQAPGGGTHVPESTALHSNCSAAKGGPHIAMGHDGCKKIICQYSGSWEPHMPAGLARHHIYFKT